MALGKANRYTRQLVAHSSRTIFLFFALGTNTDPRGCVRQSREGAFLADLQLLEQWPRTLSSADVESL